MVVIRTLFLTKIVSSLDNFYELMTNFRITSSKILDLVKLPTELSGALILLIAGIYPLHYLNTILS